MLRNIFNRKQINNAPFEIAGATLGGFTPEVEGIITLEELGNYYVESFNNSTGTCCEVILIPVDSEEEQRWLTDKQAADLLNFLEMVFAGTFGNGQILEENEKKTEYLEFENNGCKILLMLSETTEFMILPRVSICHLDAYAQLQREKSSFSSFDDWYENRKIR